MTEAVSIYKPFAPISETNNNDKFPNIFCEDDVPFDLSNVCILPKSFAPGKNDVIIGRGKKCHGHFGNKRLKRIVLSRLDEYSRVFLQKEKSRILRLIINQIRNNRHPRVGGFVKQDQKTKRWFDVGDNLAREKISKSFRDALNKREINYRHHCSKKNTNNAKTNTTTDNDLIGIFNVSSVGESTTKLFQINSLSQKLERNQTSYLSSQCAAAVSDDSESSEEDFFEGRIEPEPFSMQPPSKEKNDAYFDSIFDIQDINQENFSANIFDEPKNIPNTTEIGNSSCVGLEEIDTQGLDRNGLDTPLHDGFFYSPSTPPIQLQAPSTTTITKAKHLLYSSSPHTTDKENTKQFFKSVANFATKRRKKSTRFNILTSRQA